MPSVDDTTFLGLRTLLVTSTSHYHLVGTQVSGGDTVPDYTEDNGANFFILKAIRWWDRQARHCRKEQKQDVAVTAGDVSLEVEAHAVTKVRVSDSIYPLAQANEEYLWETYGADLSAVASSLDPAHWAKKTGAPGDTTTSIWIMPPPSEDKTVEVYGFYYTPALADDDDTNFWTLNFSEGVLYVACALVNDLDLNPFTNATLRRLVDDVMRQMISDDVQEEIAFYGTTMAG